MNNFVTFFYSTHILKFKKKKLRIIVSQIRSAKICSNDILLQHKCYLFISKYFEPSEKKNF